MALCLIVEVFGVKNLCLRYLGILRFDTLTRPFIPKLFSERNESFILPDLLGNFIEKEDN